MNQKYKMLIAIGVTTGSLVSGMFLGLGASTGVLTLPKQEYMNSKRKSKIYSKRCDDGRILKTFQSSNGEISYLVDKLAQKSIEETIFYMEELDAEALTTRKLMALYRLIDEDYDNKIKLDETEGCKKWTQDKYIKQCKELFKKNDAEKRY